MVTHNPLPINHRSTTTHTHNFCKFFIAWIKKKVFPFLHQLSGSKELQDVLYIQFSCCDKVNYLQLKLVLQNRKPNNSYFRKTLIKAVITRKVTFRY